MAGLLGAGGALVFEHPGHAGQAQRVELQGQVLIVGGNVGVADECHRAILRLAFATPKALICKAAGFVAKTSLCAIADGQKQSLQKRTFVRQLTANVVIEDQQLSGASTSYRCLEVATYARLQFEDIDAAEREAICEVLLKYYELDTF